MSIIDGTLTSCIEYVPPNAQYNPDGTQKDSEPICIDCRIEPYQSVVKDNTGKNVVSYAKIYTKASVKAGGFIILGGVKRCILSSSEIYNLWGKFEHYEVII